ncbi:MAG: glycosyltransferase [Pseudomonadota bacterium]|nr:glycosyltransferase [Pseudomonadota bacterium]
MTERAEFDAEFYLRQYPDIRKAGLDPYEHFIHYGRAEGRMGTRPLLAHVEGRVPFDRSKATILVVSHEATLSGAPVLSLNLARALREKYNVVSLLLAGGLLIEEFRNASVLVALPEIGRNPKIVSEAVVQLSEKYSFRFALVNSIESSVALQPLTRHSIPTVLSIHEFASYTRPRSVFRDAFFWADEVVFSTRMTYLDALSQHPELAKKDVQILPQGRCDLFVEEADAQSREKEIARVRATLRPAGVADDTLLVLSLGFVEIRKGVDLFIDCASRVKAQGGRRCRFIWIGKGYDPEHDLAYSLYLADQVRRAGLQDDVHFMEVTTQIDEVYRMADLLLLTSRLDPLPNVAIDAMSRGLPLVCFAGTTGIADLLSEHGLAGDCVVAYLDTSAMAAKVIEFANSPSLRDEVGQKLRTVADEIFNFASYVQDLHAVALVACEKVDREQESAEAILNSGLFRSDFLASGEATDEATDLIRWNYIRPWTAGMLPRKPFPGFHPGIYDELHDRGTDAEPLISYLRAGRPTGPWQHEVITADETPLPVPPELRIALHLHVYYPDLLPEMLQRLGRNRLQADLFISVPTADVMEQVEAALRTHVGKVVVEVVPNRGRDIGPFLTTFGPRLASDYDIVGHLHTKKTANIADAKVADTWRHFLYENLLSGEAAMADVIVGRMAEDPSIGMVFPDDPHLVGWGGNKSCAQALCRRLGMPDNLPEHFVFPIGTMFWARVDAIRPLLELGLGWEDYPVEPLPYDGSMLHALERLFPFVVSEQGGRCLLTNATGVTR